MNCPNCGNTNLIERGNEYYCDFCSSVVQKPVEKPIIKEVIKEVIKEEPKREITLDSILTLKVEDGVGTGFVISESGYVLTNRHVLGEEEFCFGKFEDDETLYELDVQKIGDEDLDLCLLKIHSSNQFKPVLFANKPAVIGQTIKTIGNPRGIGLSLSQGVISRIGDSGNIQMNMQLNTGNSGGPIFNEEGDVIGIVSFLIEEVKGISFAIGEETIKEFISDVKGVE